MRKTLTFILAVLTVFQAFGQLPGINSGTSASASSADRVLMREYAEHMNTADFTRIRLNFPALTSFTNQADKSTLIVKQRLDSIISEFYYINWLPMYRQQFTYDIQGRILTSLELEFDMTTMQWTNSGRETFEYNAAGQLIKHQEDYFNQSLNQWLGDSREEYTYNASGRIATIISSYWDQMINAFVINDKGTYAYNASGLVTEIVFEFWDSSINQWYNGYKEEYTYNANNKPTLLMVYIWDNTAQQYVQASRDEYQYHINGKVSQVMASFYDSWLLQWIPERKEEYTFDANANNTLYVFSHYDPSLQVWIPGEKSEKTFNSSNDLTSEIYSTYDENISSWIAENKVDYTHNNAYSFNDLLLPWYNDDEGMNIKELFNHMLTQYEQNMYDNSTQTWTLLGRGTLYYAPQNINGISEPAKSDLLISPNPASNYFQIDSETISTPMTIMLVDGQGRILMNQSVFSGQQIATSHLADGLYFYQIFHEGQMIHKGKLIIQ